MFWLNLHTKARLFKCIHIQRKGESFKILHLFARFVPFYVKVKWDGDGKVKELQHDVKIVGVEEASSLITVESPRGMSMIIIVQSLLVNLQSC